MIDESPRLTFNTCNVIRQFLLPFLLALPALIFTSCVEGEEEIWITPDGSGHLVAHYEIPSIALAQIGDPVDFVRAFTLIDEREDEIQITDLSFIKKGSKAIFHLEATFKDAREILSISIRNEALFLAETGCDPEKIDGIAGAIDFEIKGLTPTYERTVSPSEIFPSIVSRRPKMLGASTFKYIIHLPAKVIETNAHEVTDDRKTVSWTFILNEHFEAPMAMSFTMELPVPWWGWTILALLALVLAWLIWRFIIRRFV